MYIAVDTKKTIEHSYFLKKLHPKKQSEGLILLEKIILSQSGRFAYLTFGW